jgi:hypothetical protein
MLSLAPLIVFAELNHNIRAVAQASAAKKQPTTWVGASHLP